MSSQAAQCILVLDLASDNPVTVEAILPYVPPSTRRRCYRVTDFGAQQQPQGGAADRRGWREWTRAVDRMLEQARDDFAADGVVPHYYVAGRAGPPVFGYLGLRLGRQADITVINRRPNGQWDVVPLQQPPDRAGSQDEGERFFNVVRGLRRDDPSSADGKVAVFVSTQRDLDDGTKAMIRAFAKSLDISLAGIVTIRARPHENPDTNALRMLGAEDGPRAAQELVEHFTSIPDCYPHNSGVLVFVAGPATLCVMVGRAMNPRVLGPTWFPYLDAAKYEPAVEHPWPLVPGGKPRILVLVSNPPNAKGDRLESDLEVRGMSEALKEQTASDRCRIESCMAVRVRDLMDKLRDFKPHVLHFIGHGEQFGLYFTDHGGNEHLVNGDAFYRMLEASKVEDLRLVVLNACESSEQARELTAIVDCAIGTRVEVPDQCAIQFAQRFYDDLAHGSSVGYAFSRATAMLSNDCDGEIFTIHARAGSNPREIVLFSPASRDD